MIKTIASAMMERIHPTSLITSSATSFGTVLRAYSDFIIIITYDNHLNLNDMTTQVAIRNCNQYLNFTFFG